MSDDKLIRMANDIATFFNPYGEAEALAGIRKHIQSFWTPKMRAAMAEHIAQGAADLHPRVVMALEPVGAQPSPPAR